MVVLMNDKKHTVPHSIHQWGGVNNDWNSSYMRDHIAHITWGVLFRIISLNSTNVKLRPHVFGTSDCVVMHRCRLMQISANEMV